MSVTVIELRLTFSRVNILTLWPQTADDLMGLGAKLFYPKFTNHGDLLHMGTREFAIQQPSLHTHHSGLAPLSTSSFTFVSSPGVIVSRSGNTSTR